ncbi:MAG TPA: hypothetical protein VG826_28885 [Pirellulales bacterium]|nr:hypothetical protein [Pirellulales bacterium]
MTFSFCSGWYGDAFGLAERSFSVGQARGIVVNIRPGMQFSCLGGDFKAW